MRTNISCETAAEAGLAGEFRECLASGRRLIMRPREQETEGQWEQHATGDEERFLTLAQAVPSLMFEADAQGQNTFASNQWYEYTGLTPAETVGWGWLRALPPEDVEPIRERWKAIVQSGHPFEMKGRLRAEDGSYHWFLFRALPTHDHQGNVKGWVGSLTDIDDFVRTEEALRMSEEFSRRLLASSHDCIKVLDLDANLLSMAEGGRRLMEIEDPTPYLNKSYLNFWDTKDWPTINEALEVAKAGGVGQFEGYCPSITGKPRWWDARITPIRGADNRPERLLVIARDVTEARQSREALLRSEQRYRHLISILPVAVYTCDAEGRLELYNQQAAALWGRHPSIGEDVWCGSLAMYTVEESPLAHEDCPMAVALRRGERQTGPEIVMQRPDGSRVRVVPHVEPLVDEGGRLAGAVNVLMDITAMRQAEDALRESEERLRMANNAGAIGTYDYDRRLGRTVLSAELCSILGISDPYLTRPDECLTFVHDEDREAVLAAVARSGEHQADGIARLEMRILRPGGEVRWVSWSAHTFFSDEPEGRVPVRSIGACIDITDRRNAEQALAESEERFRVFFNNAAVGAAEVDENERFIQVNEALCRTTGYRADELLHMTPMDLTHPDDRQADLAEYLRFKAGEVPFYEADKRLLRKDGRVIWVHVTAGMVRDGRGRPRLKAMVIQDITEQKRAESDRQRLLEAERAARMESEKLLRLKDEFLSTVSHELRTPLGAIVGWTKLLSQGKAENGKAIDVIAQSATSLTQIVDDLLDMNRIMSGKISLKPEEVSVAEIVGKAIEGVQFAADAKGIQMEVQFDPTLESIECDPTRVQQIVWNLLTNAIKFTPEEGHVTVAVKRLRRHVQIQVRDTGEGIAPEFLPHIFERFRQQEGGSTRRHGGLGIGLAIVRQLVEMHGGTISAESEGEGKGATFTVSLPRMQKRAQRATGHRLQPQRPAEPSSCNNESLKGVKVLSIDDDLFSRELVERVLADAGASVATADSARRAFEVLNEYRPDVVVSDLGMPGDDGYVFVEKVRSADDWKSSLPCVALTAFSRPEDRTRAITVGFDEHIGKPFDPNKLCVVVARLANQKHEKTFAGGNNRHPPGSSQQPAHVLVAEDSRHLSEMLKEVLEHNGYRVSVAGSIGEALAIARDSRVDLLLSDLRLKDGLAWHLLSELRKRQALPAILMSGYADEVYVTRSKSAGFSEYLVKPVDPEELLRAVRQALQQQPAYSA